MINESRHKQVLGKQYFVYSMTQKTITTNRSKNEKIQNIRDIIRFKQEQIFSIKTKMLTRNRKIYQHSIERVESSFVIIDRHKQSTFEVITQKTIIQARSKKFIDTIHS